MPDITTKLAGWWKFADADVSQFDDSAPTVPLHHIPVTQNGAGFPKIVNKIGICREFINVLSGAQPDNFGRLALSTNDFNAMVGAANGNSGEVTIAFWMRAHALVGGDSTGGANPIELGGLALSSDTVQNKAIALRVGRNKSTRKYSVTWNISPSGAITFTPAYVSADETWDHVAFVVRRNVVGVSVFIDLYINGVLQETSASQTISFAGAGLPPASPFVRVSIANTQSDFPNFGQVTGYLRDLRLYARALVAGDVAALVTANPPVDIKISFAVLDGAASKTGLAVTAANTKTTLAVTAANTKTTLTADAAKAKTSAVLP